MTVPTMPPMPPIPTMPTTMHESEYYRFCVKEMKGSESGEDVIFSRLLNLNLKWLRTWLRKQFGVPENRHIFYIDDDGDNVPIDSECEFHEALKLAKSAFEKNYAIPLIVGSFNVSGEQDSWMHENRCLDKEQLRNVDDKLSWNKSFSPYHAFAKPTCLGPVCFSRRSEFVHGAQSHMWTVLPVPINFDAKQCDESNETKVRQIDEQTKSKDMDTQQELNASLESCSNTLPPLWFTEYMESMKKDMISTITNEVVKKITKTLNKRLDSFTFSPVKELDQSGSQYSSPAIQHPQCSLDSNEDNQKKMRSQKKKQEKSADFSEKPANGSKLLSDIVIERMDQPQNVNTMKNIQMKKDVISTITNEVVKEMTELLDKIPADSATSVPSKDPFRSQFLSHFPSSTLSRYSFDSHSNETNQNTIKSQDKEQSSDNASATRVDESSWYSNILENSTRKLQKRLDLIEDVIRVNAEEEMKKRHYQQIAQAFSDDLNSDIGREKEQSVQQNNTWENFVSRNLQIEPNLSDERVPLETLKLIENELRMNCSVTGNQMLDEGLLSRDICNTFDSNKLLEIEKDVETLPFNKTFFQSCNQEKREKKKEEDDDAFEIIQMSTLTDDLFMPCEEPAIEQQHDSSRDSPSFELVSEPPSPPCSIRLDEDHFSANEEKLEQHSMKTNSPNSVYVVDVHGKIFNDEHQTVNSDECVNVDLKKQPDVTYSFVTGEDLLTEDENEEACSSKLSCAEHRLYERKSSRDDANGSYDDVRNSHASYLTVQTHCDSKTQSQCSCQSQTDSGDFTQSFHSHTTSVTDTTDMYAHSYACKYGEAMTNQGCTAKDVRETTTMAAPAPRNNHDVHVDDGWAKETKTNEKPRRNKCPNNFPEYLCTPDHGCPCCDNPSFGGLHQPYQANRSSDRSCSNVGSRKASTGELNTPNTDSVHILPETLVSAAAQVGSFAYDTAREMFDKLRAHTHTKDVPLKRRGGVKRENKKPFSVSHLPF
ncbi:uncharacterized protein LOC105257772 isoform X1 [Camponotus floridanus]|uniref:uncharacterized protein LOC105257772 isoform X1 n=1 Tax=Camponotus floridanus TaxID=104421 RepID=UPI000DC6BA8B|nr:uncharacterized protein LOC105257772 isoform X1 [Camponotus floridanus]